MGMKARARNYAPVKAEMYDSTGDVELQRSTSTPKREEDNATRDAAPRKSSSSSNAEDQGSSRGAALSQNASSSEDENDAELLDAIRISLSPLTSDVVLDPQQVGGGAA